MLPSTFIIILKPTYWRKDSFQAVGLLVISSQVLFLTNKLISSIKAFFHSLAYGEFQATFSVVGLLLGTLLS